MGDMVTVPRSARVSSVPMDIAAVEQSSAGGSNIGLLTRVGGGAFGNADAWIDDAIVRALSIVEHAGLDIRLVSHGRIHDSNRAIAERFSG